MQYILEYFLLEMVANFVSGIGLLLSFLLPLILELEVLTKIHKIDVN